MALCVCVKSFCKKDKEFKTALMTSFILLLSKNVNIVMLINITTTIDKTHNIYAASTYMILAMVINYFHDLLMNYSCYLEDMNILWTRICFDLLKITTKFLTCLK